MSGPPGSSFTGAGYLDDKLLLSSDRQKGSASLSGSAVLRYLPNSVQAESGSEITLPVLYNACVPILYLLNTVLPAEL